jgi:hypothetical protein
VAALSAAEHELHAQCHRPEEIGIGYRPPGLEADRGDARLIEKLDQQDGGEAEGGQDEKPAARIPAAGRDVMRCDLGPRIAGER